MCEVTGMTENLNHFLVNILHTVISFGVSVQQKDFNIWFMMVMVIYCVSSKYLIQEKLLLYYTVFIISEFVWVIYSNASLR